MAPKKTKRRTSSDEQTATSEDDSGLTKKGEKAAAHRDADIRKRHKMLLPVKVGHDVVEAAAMKMADLHDERERLKSEKRDTLAKFRDKFTSLDGETQRCRDTVKQSTELREVDVIDRVLRTGVWERIRMDDNTLVEDARAATGEERQEALPGSETGEVKGPTPFGSDGKEDEEEEPVKGPQSKAKKK